MLNAILIPVGILGAFGLVFGIGLAIAAKVFEVNVDHRFPAVRAALPGANCGACGYPGCDALALAILNGEAEADACPVGGKKTAEAIAEIMGVKVDPAVRKIAIVICQGTFENAPDRAKYYGEKDCREAMVASGGSKGCHFGCIGYGACKTACQFDAIVMGTDGLPIIDTDKCTSCGKCVEACPKMIMTLVPKNQEVIIKCHNLNNGKIARQSCATACIACGACVKACRFEAIKVENNCAVIDYEKCRQCYECVDKCPMHCITGDVKKAMDRG